MVKRCILVLMLLSASAFSATCFAQEYSANDVLAFTRIAYVVASPNGKQVAFVTWDRSKTNPYNWRYALNLQNENGQIKEIAHADYIGSVDWSPDGKKIAYIAAQGENQILSVYQLANQQTVAVVTLSRSMDALEWSPSGQQIAFVADEAMQKTPVDDSLVSVAGGVVNAQLYLINEIASNAPIKPITPADINISGSVFGGGFDWSPNGQAIAFAYQPSSKAIDSSKSKVAVLDLSTLKMTPLSFCNTHSCNQPLYSPDGHWLAFATNILASGKAKALLEDIGTQNQICLVDQAGQTHCLQNTFNGNPYLLGWKFNSQAVYVGDQYKMEGPQLYELNENPDVPVKLVSTQKGFIEPLTLSINRSHRIFGFGHESVNQAPEVFIASADDFKLTQITHVNKQFDKPLGQEQVLNWQSTDGTNIEGLLITPENYDPKRKYPLYVDVHGGPASVQGQRYLGGCDEYSELLPPTTCPANILSLGYVILQVNYRGSNGYGLDFRVKNFGDFGGGDYNDIMTGIDHLIQQGVVDPHKIVMAGWSYGGYLAAWAISQSNRFSGAIDGDGLTDLISYTGTSDDTDFCFRYLGSYFWDANQPLYWARSPIAHVQNIKTPLLILEGGQDIRVPPSQAEELYNALTVLNRPVKMLIAPRQAHEPSDPDTIEKEINAIDQWLQNDVSSS